MASLASLRKIKTLMAVAIQPYHKNIPYIGHKRLVIIHPSSHGYRSKQSSLLGELDRIYNKVRPSLAYQPVEDYLNSRSHLTFDDETRSIRAKTAEILKRIHTPVPRAQRPLPLPGDLYYSHIELPITERITSNNYIDRLLSSFGNQPIAISISSEPKQYSRLGPGHLACLTYAGGRPISRRRNLASAEDYIRDDINVLSHYNRFRQAAEKSNHAPDAEFGPISHPPPSMSPITGSWKSNAPRRTQSDKVSSKASTESIGSSDKKKSRREALEAEALREAEEEKRRKEELKRQDELAKQAEAEREAELERKAQQEEEERIMKEENERLEALKKAQEEEERRAKEEEEARLAKEEEERMAKEAEEKRKAKEEEERRAEEERKAREEEERKMKEEEERRLKEEAERLAREEEERRAEEERLAREEEERRLKEEEEEEEERRRKEEEEQRRREEEEKATAKEEEEEEMEEIAEESRPQADIESEGEPIVEEPTSPDEAPAKVFAEDEGEEEEEEEEDD